MNALHSTLDAALPWLLYATLIAACLAGLFLNILGLPGLWLIVIAAIAYGWWFDFAYIGWWTIGIVALLGAMAELVEFLAGAAGSKQAGGSKRGMIGAVIGGLVGSIVGTPLIPIPILGTIIGSVAGCFAGAYLIEWWTGRTHRDAAQISLGAAKGRVVGLVAKTVFGVVMALVTILVGLPVDWGRTAVPLPATQPTTVATSEPVTPR